MVNGFIIDKTKSKRNGQDVTVYLLQHEIGKDADGKLVYLNPKKGEVRNFTEEELIQYVVKYNINLYNAQIKDNKIVSRDASLARFEQAGYTNRIKPYTVCAEIRSDKGVLLGYRVASARSGDVKPVSVENFIKACEKMMIDALKVSNNPKELFKPVQNMKFSPKVSKLLKTASLTSVALENMLKSICVKSGLDMVDEKESFLSIYNTNNPLPVEVWQSKENTYVQKQKESPEMEKNASKIEKKSTDISTIFTPEQLKALAEAKAKGVDIRKIANPKLSAKRMRVIANIEAEGKNGAQINNPDFGEAEFDYLAANIKLDVDVSQILNPAYNVMQMTVILAGIMEGLDINKYSNPSLPYEIMAQRRRDMLDAAWCDDLGIIEGTKYV